ncbi:glycine-rich domain-containing protein 1 [Tanacetum coccineum]
MKDDIFLEGAVERYKGFLHMIRRNMETKSKNFCVLTYDIDSMWHTHQLHPLSYFNDTVSLLGKVLGHDDIDSDRTKDVGPVKGQSHHSNPNQSSNIMFMEIVTRRDRTLLINIMGKVDSTSSTVKKFRQLTVHVEECELHPDMVATYTASAQVFEGHPFTVEVGVSLGRKDVKQEKKSTGLWSSSFGGASLDGLMSDYEFDTKGTDFNRFEFRNSSDVREAGQQRQVVVRSFQIAIHLDLMLILKLAAIVFLFNQDGSRKGLSYSSFLSLIYFNNYANKTLRLEKLSLVLPETPPYVLRQFSGCAVIGNSGDLLKTKFEKEIDSYDVVLRENGAPIQITVEVVESLYATQIPIEDQVEMVQQAPAECKASEGNEDPLSAKHQRLIKGLVDGKALASNLKDIQVKDIVKEVEDYLNTYSPAEMDIRWYVEGML